MLKVCRLRLLVYCCVVYLATACALKLCFTRKEEAGSRPVEALYLRPLFDDEFACETSSFRVLYKMTVPDVDL